MNSPSARPAAAAADCDFNLLWFVPGLLVAVAIHTAFNQFPDQPVLAMIGTLVARADRHHGDLPLRRGRGPASGCRRSARTHRVHLAAWEAGKFPDDESGAKIAALVARLGREDGRAISANIASS